MQKALLVYICWIEMLVPFTTIVIAHRAGFRRMWTWAWCQIWERKLSNTYLFTCEAHQYDCNMTDESSTQTMNVLLTPSSNSNIPCFFNELICLVKHIYLASRVNVPHVASLSSVKVRTGVQMGIWATRVRINVLCAHLRGFNGQLAVHSF